MIYFLTGNKNKVNEAKSILGDIFESHEIDLPEIQELDPQKIIAEKLQEAKKHKDGEYFVEDTSLYIDGMGGLPGPLVKWFLSTIGNEGIYELSKKWGEAATAKTVIGHIDSNGAINFVEGVVKGKIVEPRGETNFGWDPIFVPEGHSKTFAEMSSEEKNNLSMRKLALYNLKKLLHKNNF